MSSRDIIRNVVARIAEEEQRLLADSEFLAPRVRGGLVRARVAGAIYTFRVDGGFEGWGRWRPVDARSARLEAAATVAERDAYLERLRPLRVILARPLVGQAWVVYPFNESDARQKGWDGSPLVLQLVGGYGRTAQAFDRVVAYTDGAAFWCGEADGRADPRDAAMARRQLSEGNLELTIGPPELRVAYSIVIQQDVRARAQRERRRLEEALAIGGGKLDTYDDRGATWLVNWRTSSGERHSSVVRKSDLTVTSAGICLSGRDADFDLHALVGVVDGRHNAW